MYTKATVELLKQVQNACLIASKFLIDVLRRKLDKLEGAYTLLVEGFELALVALEAKADEA